MDENKRSEINFDSIAAMMCGQKLTEDQKKDVEEFNRQYDKETARRKAAAE